MSLEWQQLTTRRDALILQHFRCTSDLPRSERGRKLPHPKPWEFEVQAYLRQLSLTLRPEQVLLVGREREAPLAAAVLEDELVSPNVLRVFIAAAAVEVNRRGGDRSAADATMNAILDHARAQLTDVVRTAVVIGNVHHHNEPSQRWLQRTGFEPVGLPTGDYQPWACRVVA